MTPTAPAPKPADKPTGYTVGQFRDNVQSTLQKKDVYIPNYECDHCAFATIDLDKMHEHQKTGVHIWGKESK